MLLPISEKKCAGQIGPAPFARAGIHVECEEIVPDLFSQFATGKRVYGDAASIASLRSRRMALRLREARAARKSSKLA